MTRRPLYWTTAVALGLFGLSTAAWADRPDLRDYVEPYFDEPYRTSSSSFGDHDLVVELGVGAIAQPRFEGSDDVIVRPWPLIALEYFALPNGFSLGGKDERGGVSFRPDFNLRGERDDDDIAVGLGDIDRAYEFGGAVALRAGPLEAEVVMRRGLGGHRGFVGEVTVKAIVEPSDRFEISFGPQVTFASENYMDTYFGVSAAQAARSGLNQFEASGGIKSVGIVAESRYQFTENWAVLGEASYHQLVNDAAKSPVVKRGKKDQFTVGVGLAYRFGLDLY